MVGLLVQKPCLKRKNHINLNKSRYLLGCKLINDYNLQLLDTGGVTSAAGGTVSPTKILLSTIFLNGLLKPKDSLHLVYYYGKCRWTWQPLGPLLKS